MGSHHHPEEQSEKPIEAAELETGVVAENTEQSQTSDAPEAVESEPSAEDKIAELQDKLNVAEAKAEENWDKLLRVNAEMENLRRRTEKDLENANRFALERFSKELLQVIDSLEMGLKSTESATDNLDSIREGMELTMKQFVTVLEKFNVVQLNPEGQPFNPEQQQAMSMQPSADVPANTVLHVFQKGYELNGRLIRPAMVVVSQAVERQPEKKIDEQA